ITIKVLPKVVTQLKTQVSLIDERGGTRDGILEPRETAKLELLITNEGEVDARRVIARLLNFSGKQLEVSGEKHEISVIGKGEVRRVLIDIRAADRLINPKLDLGLSLSSQDLLDPIQRSVFINSQSQVGENVYS